MKRKGKQRIPWQDIKRDYIQGFQEEGKRHYPTIRELVTKHNISISTIGTKAHKENWVLERERYQNRIETKTEEKKIEAISSEAASLDTEFLRASRFYLGLALGKAQSGISDDPDRPGKKIIAHSAGTIKQLADATSVAQRMAKIALGEGSGETSEEALSKADLRDFVANLDDKELRKLHEKLGGYSGGSSSGGNGKRVSP